MYKYFEIISLNLAITVKEFSYWRNRVIQYVDIIYQALKNKVWKLTRNTVSVPNDIEF